MHGRGDGCAQVVERGGQHGAVGFQEVGAPGGEDRRALGHRGAESAADAVPVDRRPGLAADGVRDPGRAGGVALDVAQRDRTDPPAGCPGEGSESRTVADSPDQAESRFRPRVRRDRSTARPPRVRIRVRKPWVFLRFLVLGWYVRFTTLPPRVNRAKTPWQRARAGGGSAKCTGRRAPAQNAPRRARPSSSTPCRAGWPVLRFRASRGSAGCRELPR